MKMEAMLDMAGGLRFGFQLLPLMHHCNEVHGTLKTIKCSHKSLDRDEVGVGIPAFGFESQTKKGVVSVLHC